MGENEQLPKLSRSQETITRILEDVLRHRDRLPGNTDGAMLPKMVRCFQKTSRSTKRSTSLLTGSRKKSPSSTRFVTAFTIAWRASVATLTAAARALGRTATEVSRPLAQGFDRTPPEGFDRGDALVAIWIGVSFIEGTIMRSALLFLIILFVFVLGISAYELIVLVQRLPFEPNTISDIVSQAITPLFLAAAIVLPWQLLQNWRGKFSPMPILAALAVIGYWQYQFYAALKESIGQWMNLENYLR
jgi:hypothetical protein